MYELIIIPIGLAAMLLATYQVRTISKMGTGTAEMKRISDVIREGAEAYLRRQHRVISVFAIALMVMLGLVFGLLTSPATGLSTALAFILGAALSALTGHIGMKVALKANVRTANRARKGNASDAFITAFKGGTVTGLLLVVFSLFGLYVLYMVNGLSNLLVYSLLGFGVGASLDGLFMRVGGGIYTKAADMGADFVGKVEKGIPEDDPRNPAVIADLVGDNVGDCAGRGADLFESNADNLICMMIVAVAFVMAMDALGHPMAPEVAFMFVVFPLLGRSFDVLATTIGVLAARPLKSPVKALNISIILTSAILAICFYFLASLVGYIQLFFCALLGMLSAIVLALAVQYYTGIGKKPVVETAKAAQMGAAINIITGLSYGLESTAIPLMGVLSRP